MSAQYVELSAAARQKIGRNARERASRQSLGGLDERPAGYDAVGRLMAQGEHRVASLLPIRYQRMLESPLAFYRGAALLMADDLARATSSPLEVQICGDAHLSNFGVFSSPERQLVFDVNDFDETEVGPFEWDVKRLIASLVISSEQLGHKSKQQENIALSAAREYRTTMASFARQTRLQVWYAKLDLNFAMKELRGFFSDSARERVDDVFRRVKDADTSAAFAKVVAYTEDGVTIRNNPPHFAPLDSSVDGSMTNADAYEIVRDYVKTLSSDRQVLLGQYVARDVARHVVGVGSVGTECLAVLLCGRDDRDPLLLQVKEAQTSVISEARGSHVVLRSRRAGGARPAPDASDPGPPARLAVDRSTEEASELLRSPALRQQGVGERGAVERAASRRLRSGLRVDVGPSARSIGIARGDRWLPGQGFTFRRGNGRIRAELRQEECEGLRGIEEGGSTGSRRRGELDARRHRRQARSGPTRTLGNIRIPGM